MSEHDDTGELAELIRNAAAWWRRAAELIQAGDFDDAVTCAKLGEFGLEGMVERIVGASAAARAEVARTLRLACR